MEVYKMKMMKKIFSLTVLTFVLAMIPLTAFAKDSDYGDLGWYYVTTSYKITSPYGDRGGVFHKGIDIGVDKEPAYSISKGKVKYAGYSETAGNWVVIESEDKDPNGKKLTARYLHLNSYSVSTGDTVKRGDKIGVTGNTGNSTGPHLHFDVNNANKMNGSDLNKNNTINPVLFWPNAKWSSVSSHFEIDHHEGDLILEEAIFDFLIEYVGINAFEEWKNATDNPVQSEFLNHFDLSKNDMHHIYNEFISEK